MSQCASTGLQQTVHVTGSHVTSMSIFSTIHLTFVITVLVWVSTSFTLISLGGWTTDNWIDDFVIVMAMMGHAAFIVGSLFPILWTNNTLIPVNNLFIAVFTCVATAAMQWLWVNTKKPPKDDSKKEEPGETVGFNNFSLRGPARYQKVSGKYTGEDFYMKNILEMDWSERFTVSETFVTTPLLFVCTLAATAPSIPTWALQFVFFTMMISHILVIPARKLEQVC